VNAKRDSSRVKIERSSLGDANGRLMRSQTSSETGRAVLALAAKKSPKPGRRQGEGYRTHNHLHLWVLGLDHTGRPLETTRGGDDMAKNTGHGYRRGEVTGRSQTYTPVPRLG